MNAHPQHFQNNHHPSYRPHFYQQHADFGPGPDFGAPLGPPRFNHNHNNRYQNNAMHHHQHQSFAGGSNVAASQQLMSFHNYVKQLSNSVDESTAHKKYKDFMANLTQSKVGRFFEANKDREWFRLKYHPIESQNLLQQQSASFQKRLSMFNLLNEQNYFDSLAYAEENTAAIINLMDAIIVHLEDGPSDLVDNLLSRADTQIDPDLRQKFVPVKPVSVVIDDINIETTLAEIQEFCQRAHPDLLKIAPLDPYYIEEGYLRRKVIAIYANHVDIKEVCWKLSRIKLKNRLLNVSINKPLTKRVIGINPVANDHVCIINDIRIAIILVLNFDELKGLYGKRKQLLETIKQDTNKPPIDIKMEELAQDDDIDSINNVAPLSPPGSVKSGTNEEDENKPFNVNSLDEDKEKEKKKLYESKFNLEPSLYRQVSKLSKNKNPILEGAYLYLVEYTNSSCIRYQLSQVPKDLLIDSVKEELKSTDQGKLETLQLIVDNLPHSVEQSARFLDKLLWYLRIVHSFDYYSKSICRHEDDLIYRLGVVHVRGSLDDEMLPLDETRVKEYLRQTEEQLEKLNQFQTQRFVTKDEERYNYKSYGKVITDELTTFSQRVPKPNSTETEEVYKCRHCSRIFQKLGDIGRHFVSKHRWAIDALELETDFFNAYLFDPMKIDPCPPKELLNLPPSRFAKITSFNQLEENPDELKQALESYSKMESFVKDPAPRAKVEDNPRNDSIVMYDDISFDDAI